jgi:hypothetical protein
MKHLIPIAIVIIVITIISCSSILEKQDIHNTILFGKVYYNGMENKNLEITINSKKGGIVFTINVNKNFIVYNGIIESGIYYISEIKYKNSNDLLKLPENTYFEIISGGINNIGVIALIKDDSIVFINQNDKIKNEYLSIRKNSSFFDYQWHTIEWVLPEIISNIETDKRNRIGNYRLSENEMKLLMIISAEYESSGSEVDIINEPDYKSVDEMESIGITNEELIEFIYEGGLILNIK